MPSLHTVNQSAFERNSLASCLSVCKPGASILLIENAVVAAVQHSSVADKMIQAMQSGIKIFVLIEDLKARGLPEQRLLDQIKLIDYSGFVTLVTENDRVQSWL